MNWPWISYGLPSNFATVGNIWSSACITFTPQKNPTLHFLPLWFTSAKNIKLLDTVVFLGGGEDSLWGCWLLVA